MATVDDYLDQMTADRRAAISAVREVVLANLPPGFVEAMDWGMISYQVPLATFADTYNGRPLQYAALADQKRHMAVYLTSVYSDPDRLERFRVDYLATGKKLDMGKSCVRFTAPEDLPLEVIGDVIADTTVEQFLGIYRSTRY